MSNFRAAPWLFVAAFLAAAVACAQPADGTGTRSIEGQVFSSGETRMSGLTAVLSGTLLPAGARTQVDASGSFRFDGMPEGGYELSIADSRGEVRARQMVFLNGPTQFVSISLKDAPTNASPADAVVSACAPAHKPSRAAVRAYEAGKRARQKGDLESWAARLNEAVRIDPQYAAAVHDLGLYFLMTKRPAQALPEFEAALALDDASASAHTNAAIALLELNRDAEAESHLHKALQLNPRSPRARYLLGVIYYRSGRAQDAVAMCRPIAGEVPDAKALIAHIESQTRPVSTASASRP